MMVSELEYSVDEDLPNFFESIKKSSALELVDENKNMMENFGFETTDPDTVEGLSRITMPFKAMQGSPWYQVLSNPSYSFKFNYIGAYVGEREKLIEDGWADESDPNDESEMTDMCRRVRFEQSDMIMILLNLSYIPDEVVRFIDFEPGWSKRFYKHMDAFKEIFERKYERKWEYQNGRLETEYSKFFHQKLKEDKDMIQKLLDGSHTNKKDKKD